MKSELEQMHNIPITTSIIASLYPENKAQNQKVRMLERSRRIIRLKKGLYVVSPDESRMPISTELIANHLYTPSYISMSSALRYYGLIPEAVYTTQSMTIKHTRTFDTPIGRFEFQMIDRESFGIGINIIRKEGYAFTIASPEKALCDLIANSPMVNLRYLKDVETYLEQDIRMELEDFCNMDIRIFEQYASVGNKANSIETLIRYLQRAL